LFLFAYRNVGLAEIKNVPLKLLKSPQHLIKFAVRMRLFSTGKHVFKSNQHLLTRLEHATVAKDYIQVMQTCNAAKDSAGTFAAWSLMQTNNVTPQPTVLNMLIQAHIEERANMKEVVDLVEQFKDMDILPNIVTYNTMICGYFFRKDVQKARYVFEHLKSQASSIYPDVVTYNSMIDGLLDNNQLDVALELFEEMQNAQIVPNEKTYSSLIQGFLTKKDLERAILFFREMQQRGLVLDFTVLKYFFRQFRVVDSVDEAMIIYEEIKDCEFVPRLPRIQENAFGGHVRLLLTHELLQNMGKPALFIFNCILDGIDNRLDSWEQKSNDLWK
jgi:pentatricopeptide repeat protein